MTEDEPLPKPKRRIWLIVLLAVGIPALLGIVCCGGLAYFGFNMGKDLVVSAVSAQNFLNELAGKRVDEAYQSTSSGFKKGKSLDEFRALVAKNPALTNSSNTQVSGLRMDKQNNLKKAVLNATVSNATGSLTCTITLVEEDGAWKVDTFTVP